MVARQLFGAALAFASAAVAAAPPLGIDLANWPAESSLLTRVYGSVGIGVRGLPVAGGGDADGDGFVDFAFASMQASPLGRTRAGQVFLVFGDGTIGRRVDTSLAQQAVLSILGEQVDEHAGSEIWMDDVDGDNVADLLICRQDYSPTGGRLGAGALTIVRGGSELRAAADTLEPWT